MNVRAYIFCLSALLTGIGSLALSCMGGSAEQGNARISGAVSGVPGSNSVVEVQLVEKEFDPFDERSGVVYSTKADSTGKYLFPEVPFGSYYLYAFDGTHAYSLLDGPYTVEDDEEKPMNATLQKASVVTILDSGAAGGSSARFYIKGTSMANLVSYASRKLVKLIGVPAGNHDVLRHDSSSEKASVYTRNLEVLPDDSITISQSNRPPRILAASLQLPAIVYVDSAYALVIDASDPDSDSVMYGLATVLESGSIDSVSGVISWTPKQSEIRLSRILVKVADPNGAYSVFKWDFIVRNNASAPTPQAPVGASECFAESTTVYTAPESGCASSLTTYRFSWGDGDTTGFSDVLSKPHAWVRPGIYQVRVQVRCNDYALPSAWSLPLAVTVNEYRTTPVPTLAVPDTVHGYDTSYIEPKYSTVIRDTTFETILVTVTMSSCGSAPLYRLYCNGQLVGDWIEEALFNFVPDSFGIYEFRAAAWCDTSVAVPSTLSEACTVVVAHALRPPVISGDKNYGLTTPGSIKLDIKSETPADGISVFYRMSVGFKNIGYENTTVEIGLMEIDTCADDRYCIDSVYLYNFKPTDWFSGNIMRIILDKPSGMCQIQAQVTAKGKSESDWAAYYVNP